MKIGEKFYGAGTIPRYTADVKMRIDEDIRIIYHGRPMKLYALTVYLTRPTGHGAWAVDRVEANGSYARGHISLDGASEQERQQVLASLDPEADWRIATYTARDFTIIPELQAYVDRALELVEQDCAAAGNP